MIEVHSEATGSAWIDLLIAESALAIDLSGRVERGAKLLDERRPGWAERVNLDELAMDSCHNCVIGQVYRNYVVGHTELGLDAPEEDAHCGFDFGTDDVTPPRWAALADLWRGQVRQRLVLT